QPEFRRSFQPGKAQLFAGRVSANGETLIVNAQDGGTQEFLTEGIPNAIAVVIDPDAILSVAEQAVGVAVHAANHDLLAVHVGAAFHLPAGGNAQRPADPTEAKDDSASELPAGGARGDHGLERDAPFHARALYQVLGRDVAVAIGIDVEIDLIVGYVI